MVCSTASSGVSHSVKVMGLAWEYQKIEIIGVVPAGNGLRPAAWAAPQRRASCMVAACTLNATLLASANHTGELGCHASLDWADATRTGAGVSNRSATVPCV